WSKISTRTALLLGSFTGGCLVAVAILCSRVLGLLALVCRRAAGCLACDLLFGDGIDLGKHLLHPATNFFAFALQLDHLAAHGFHFFFALFELFLQALGIPFRRGACFAGGLI